MSKPIREMMIVAVLGTVGILGTRAPAQDPCVVGDNGTGTVTLPPEGCAYLSPTQVHMIIDGLPPGTEILLDVIHLDFICAKGPQQNCNTPDPLGGETERFDSTLQIQLQGTGDLAGFNRQIDVPVFSEVQTGPRTPGDPVQTFANEMVNLFGVILGDPDFDQLVIMAGQSNGLPPSTGQTTLTDQGDGTFQVDSFFDIIYQIDFVGAPGGALGGLGGSTQGTIGMEAQGLPNGAGGQPCTECGPGVHFIDLTPCPPGVDNLNTGALIGIDTNLDCTADTSLVMSGPVTINRTGAQDDSTQFPGTRLTDGHNDVIDTEIISMDLIGGAISLTAGAGLGNIPLAPSLGTIAEQPGNPALADSEFQVFFEVDLGGGQFAYNQTPLTVKSVIDCIPPKAEYIHPVGCIELFTSPIPGQGTHIANLVTANHETFPACGSRTAGDCLIDNGTPFCDNAACCDAVCALDPVCCDAGWDQICADEAALEPACQPTGCVPPGDDCWSTACGGASADFSDNPIPADFFALGSPPFDGVIQLGGASGGADTVVRRTEPLCFDDALPTSTAQAAIELVQLDLVGCQPITVLGEDWNVRVGLSGLQPPGTLTATKTGPDGGTFNAEFMVQPVYTFTRVLDPTDVRVLDTAAEGIPPIQLQTVAGAPWSTDESLDPCSPDGFAPGFTDDGSGQLCCPETCHSSFGTAPHEHCTTPPDCPACPVGFIPAGDDCWQTPCGATRFDFCDHPIPADFFDPGSEPFGGEVRLGGAGGLQGDTTMRRLQDMLLPTPGSSDRTPIELVSLNLVSCDPITVVIGGQDTLWDVAVGLSSTPAPLGQMTVDKTHDNGGTFTAEFNVQPVFTFTRVGAPLDVRVLDTGQAGELPAQLKTVATAPWVHKPTIQVGPVCGVNFVPGVQGDPNALTACQSTEQCCTPVGHAGPGHLHVTGQSCTPCPCGACCDPADGSCTEINTATPQADCEAAGGQYKGDGSSCADTDNDGIADWFETNDCCEGLPRDRCNTGTDPNNPDTDGDGIDDGTELDNGTDPCVPNLATVPVITDWGLLAFAMLLVASGSVVARRRRMLGRS